MISAGPRMTARAFQVLQVEDAAGERHFRAALSTVYRRDPNWVPPLPGEERHVFDERRNPQLRGVGASRWVLLERGVPVGRVAAFAPAHRPGVGYVGFFECPDDRQAARVLLDAAEAWLRARHRLECYGPIAVTPRERIGLLMEGFDRPPMLFTPYNPPYYAALLEAAAWAPHLYLRAYGWDPGCAEPRLAHVAARAAARSGIRIRPLRLEQLRNETRVVAALINETLAGAWHFDPIGEEESDEMARLLRPILDPSIALVAEDDSGPCGVALGVPDVNWLWRRAGGQLWPLGWARALRWRHHIPQARIMALGLAPRARGTGLAARLIDQLHRAGRARGFACGELSQVYEDNEDMRRILDRMRFPVVRRYAVFARRLEAA